MKKSISFIFFFSIVLIRALYGQSCDTTSFQSIYYNKNIKDARIKNISITPTGFIYISGYTESAVNNSTDAWMMKTTMRGTPLWSRAIGTSTSETVNTIKRLNDGAFVVAGGTRSGSKFDEGWIAKIDSNGMPQWSVKLGTSFSNLSQVIELNDGGLAAAGSLYLDFKGDDAGNITEVNNSTNIVIRLDKNGNTLWWKSFHFNNTERLNAISLMDDGALLVAGNVIGSLDGYLIKMNADNGNIIWMNGYQSTSEDKYGHGTELADGTIQLTNGNKIYNFTANGNSLPGEYIILRSNNIILKDVKPEEGGYISPGVRIYFANIDPKPVLFAVQNDSVIWARTYKQGLQNLGSFNGLRIYKNNIFLPGAYRTANLSDGNADENLTYLIKTDGAGKTFCSDTANISMEVVPVSAGSNITHSWIYEGVLNPQFIQLYSESLEPVRLGDCFTQTCCRDTIINNSDFICEGSTYQLPGGLIVSDSGSYISALNTAGGCDSITYTNLLLKKHFNFSLGNDTCLINNAPVTFTLPSGDDAVQYRWQDGSSSSTYTANFPGEYWVVANSGCNTVTDSVKVYDDCMPAIYIPSAFTPNKDALNDIFRIIDMKGQHLSNFNIYNRYGQLVFATADTRKGWDGSVSNIPQPSGTYVYFVRYTDLAGNPHQLKGTLVLIR